MTNKQILIFCCILLSSAEMCAITINNLGINQKTAVLGIPIVTGRTISQPGLYKLVTNLTDQQIIIDSDNVTLLFNGFSINNPTLLNDALVINPGHKDILIQGGEISGNYLGFFNGINIASPNSSSITIQKMKISFYYNGINCLGASDILCRSNIFSNCYVGINGGGLTNARFRQCLISAPEAPIGPGTLAALTRGMSFGSCTDTTIDRCFIVMCGNGILTSNCQATVINSCVFNIVTGADVGVVEQLGIESVNGTASVIENCKINSVKSINNINFIGIKLFNESNSVIRNCVVNNVFPDTGVIFKAVGIQIQTNNPFPNYWVVQNNIVSNIFGNNPANTSYGYELIDPVHTATFIFDNNRAERCTHAFVQPYSPNIPNTVTGPQATNYPWNWIVD